VESLHVTTDRSGLEQFRGLGTNREVLVNADPKGRIVLLREPSKEEVIQAIKEYNTRRITYWWDTVVAAVRTDQKQAGNPPTSRYLNGFQTITISKGYGKYPMFQYIKSTALKKYLPATSAIEALDYCLNLTLEEQKELINTLRPTNADELLRVVPVMTLPRALEFNFLKWFSACDSFILFLDSLIRTINGRDFDSVKEFRFGWLNQIRSTRIMELLGYLHQKGWLLLNKKKMLFLQRESGGESYMRVSESLGIPIYWNEESVKLATEIVEEYKRVGLSRTDYRIRIYKRLCLLLRSSTIESIGDFSPELLIFNESHLEDLRGRDIVGIVRHLTNAITRTFKKDPRFSHLPFPVMSRTHLDRHTSNPEELRTKGFRWVLETNPELVRWVELLEEYTKTVRMQNASSLILHLNRWLKYLSEIGSPPLRPEEVDRVKHINNVWNPSVNTYVKYLDTTELSHQSKHTALMALRRAFDSYNDKLLSESHDNSARIAQLPNPVKVDDGWNYSNKRKTHRYSLGTELLDLLREILLDRDEGGTPTFNWVMNRSFSKRDWIFEVDPETNETNKVWWPGCAIAIYVLLTVPLRSFQVRWLDEGIGDEYLYDFTKQCLVPNSHPSAEPGRQEGVFRLVRDPFHVTPFLGLWVNTNKTKQYDPSVVRGYEIPWPNDELFGMLRLMKDWNDKYFPNPEPISLADDTRVITTEAVKPYMPKFYPLFRDRCGEAGRNPNLPVAKEKLSRMWAHLLAEAERRLKESGKTVELVEWVDRSSGPRSAYQFPRAKFDLHSLRVSGITSLIEKGIPVHLVSEYIAGHSTIIMTLYYEKTSLFKIREMLLRAQDKVETDLNGCLTLLDRMDNPESILVWNSLEYNDDSAMQAFRANRGLWQVDLEGICPGTVCEEGGPLNWEGKATGVPTGACGLCRYYITGPAFLYGQMHKLNNLMFTMREKGEELTSLRRQEIDLEEDGQKRSLHATRGRRERIDRELKDIVHEWCNRYRLFQASLALLDEYDKKKRKYSKGGKALVPLLTANTIDGFKPIVSEASNTSLLRQISLTSEVLGNFNLHKGPILEYEEILNTILLDNDFEALLLTIPKQKRVAAANLLGEFLVNSLGDDAIDHLRQGNSLPQSIREQTQGLIEYLKSNRFTIDAPAPEPENRSPGRTARRKKLTT
jgi:hypothetical protein